jgi:hypothetical protein
MLIGPYDTTVKAARQMNNTIPEAANKSNGLALFLM